MIAYDGYLNRLPLEPSTVMRGMASIKGHRDRNHEHKSYKIQNLDELFKIAEEIRSKSDSTEQEDSGHYNYFSVYNDIVLPSAWTPQKGVDQNCPYSLLRAIPMASDGVKQPYQV